MPPKKKKNDNNKKQQTNVNNNSNQKKASGQQKEDEEEMPPLISEEDAEQQKSEQTQKERDKSPNQSSSSSQSTPEKAARLEKIKANQAYSRGDYNSALTIYGDAIALRPVNDHILLSSLFLNRGLCNLRLANYVVSLQEDFPMALQLNGTLMRGYVGCACALFHLLKFEDSIVYLQKAIKLAESPIQSQLQNLIQDIQNTAKRKADSKQSNDKKKAPKEINWMDLWFFHIDQEQEELVQSLKTTTKADSKTQQHQQQSQQQNQPQPQAQTQTQTQTQSQTSQSQQPASSSLSDFPSLVPIGEALTDSGSASYLSNNSKKDQEEALKEKEQGNRAFSEANFLVALNHYSKAIRLDPKEAVFFSNRALVYLKLGRCYEAISDCTASIDRNPSIKAYARRAAAWSSLKEYFLAAEDYKRALKFESKNQDCLQELEKCLQFLQLDYKHKLDQDPDNEKLKKSLHNVKEDLKRIAAKK